MTSAIVRRAAARAAEQRRALGLGTEPILGLRELVEQQGLLVYETRIEEGSLSGCFAVIGDSGWIMVNTAHSCGRQRFTLAHEYCHSLEHRDLKFVVCTRDKPEHEVYADAFAAAFLMPSESVETFFASDVAIGRAIEPARIIEYCYAYGASYEAVVHRLCGLKLISAPQRRTLLGLPPLRIARMLGYDTGDPNSPFFRSDPACTRTVDGLPRAYRAAAFRAYAQDLISEPKLAALLGVDEDDLDEVLGPDELNEMPVV